MIKIVIDLTPLYARKITGVEAYGIEFYLALKKTSYEIYPIFRIENTLDNNPNTIIINHKSRLISENYTIPKILKYLKPSIAFFPIFPPPINVYNIDGVKIVPTIHDLAFRYYTSTLSLKARLYLLPKYNRALKYSNSIITISNSVLMELKKETKVTLFNFGESISVSYKLHDFIFDATILNKYSLQIEGYLISVSTLEPRKNIKYLLEVWKILYKQYPSLKLVLVGRHGWGNTSEYSVLLNELKDSIVFTGYVEHADLVNLYHYSKAFILLSLYEGFGRTPLEALACETRVITSDIPVFRENVGQEGCYVVLNDAEKAALQIESYIMKNKVKRTWINDQWFNVMESNIISNINKLL